MKLRRALFLAFLAPSLLINTAHAASTASASVSIAEIVLTDLDLNDGIAPSLQIVPENIRVETASVYYTPRGSFTPIGDYDESKNDLAPLDAQLSVGNLLAGTATKRGTSLDTLALSTELSASAGSIKSAASRIDSSVRLRLSPNTSISITFNVDVQADSVPGESESALGSLIISMHPAEASIPLPDDLNYHLSYSENASGQGQGQAGPVSWTGTYELGKTAYDLRLHLDAVSAISPVPEPHTYGMLAAGLLVAGAAGWLQRRRATKRSA